MHLAIDLDDVVLDFFQGVLDSFEREYGVSVRYDGSPWGPRAVEFTKHPLLLASGYRSWWDWLRDRDWLWHTFPAVPGAIGGIQTLRKEGHYLECVTSKPEWAEFNVWRWMGKWRPRFNRVTVVTNGQSKLDFTEAALIVDDRLATCVEWADAGRFGVHFDRALPKEESPVNPRLYKTHSWHDVVETVRELDAKVAA